MNFQINKYKSKYKPQIISVWEKSVLATHHFLTANDYTEIRALLLDYDFELLDMFCLMDKEAVIGFIGLHNYKIEMLFLDPAYIGKGLGKQLIDFAISKHGATLVDVNEQNVSAKKFYEKIGFQTYE
ncbi:MAG: GNAT family N-acetyltransferase, partial [Chitinophagaceae bacterium]